jgi:hypothetical protein
MCSEASPRIFTVQRRGNTQAACGKGQPGTFSNLIRSNPKVAQLIEEGQKLQAQLMKSADRNKRLQEKGKEADAAAVQLNARLAKYESQCAKSAP